MENAEEVLQLLEEFSKSRPKEIPRELEEYLGYVAKTGDPVFQWSLVKSLFREKLINVINDFHESTLTVELPPCPNVEPFSYERMKASLLERFDMFCSAPFTVQRICELLTNPRKEYNRADKYMRAIEKNILVVSTREPGSGKRALECDSQTETVLNGMPEMKFSDGSLLHIPTDLPYLGAPPASNDVTVETTEPTSTRHVNEHVGLDLNGESINIQMDSSKPWQTQESTIALSEGNESNGRTVESCEVNTNNTALETDTTVKSQLPEEQSQDSDCDPTRPSRLITLPNEDDAQPLPYSNLNNENSSILHSQLNEKRLVDKGMESVDSSDSSSQDCGNIETGLQVSSKSTASSEELESGSDENEVSSTPTDIVTNKTVVSVEGDEPTDSEAEATDGSSFGLKCSNSLDLNLDIPDSEVNSSETVINANERKTDNPIMISEIDQKPTETDDVLNQECSENEITGNVSSPLSPNSNLGFQAEHGSIDVINECDQTSVGLVVARSEQSELHPDSSDEVGSGSKAEATSISLEHTTASNPEVCSEADSASNPVLDRSIEFSDVGLQSNNNSIDAPDQTNLESCSLDSVSVKSPSRPTILKTSQDNVNTGLKEIPEISALSSNLVEDTISTEESCPNVGVEEGSTNALISTSSRAVNETTEAVYSQENREESVIHSLSSVTVDNVKELVTIEEISVDPSCEMEEEAMDVDDSSNQMMVSEGENESEPMDQSDQQQS